MALLVHPKPTPNLPQGTRNPDRDFNQLYMQPHYHHGDKAEWDSPQMKEGDTSAIKLHLLGYMQ